MSDLKPKGVTIKLGNEEYGMRFTLNAIDDIQDHFDIAVSEISKLFEDEKKQIKNVIYLLKVLINEDIDCKNDETGENRPHVDERFVGRHIDVSNLKSTIAAIYGSFTAGAPECEDDDPNQKSE